MEYDVPFLPGEIWPDAANVQGSGKWQPTVLVATVSLPAKYTQKERIDASWVFLIKQ